MQIIGAKVILIALKPARDLGRRLEEDEGSALESWMSSSSSLFAVAWECLPRDLRGRSCCF